MSSFPVLVPLMHSTTYHSQKTACTTVSIHKTNNKPTRAESFSNSDSNKSA